MSAPDWQRLIDEAFAARGRAYAPYSKYHVGAALLGADGRVFTGCNVENASYGLCICAERSAIAKAVDAGCTQFTALVVAVGGPKAASPCGMCRQVLSEFPPSFPVRCISESGDVLDTSVSALLPHAFGPGHLDG